MAKKKMDFSADKKPLTMKINDVPVKIGTEQHFGAPAVYFIIGHQGFHMNGMGTKTHAKIIAKILRKAFRKLK